MRMQVITSYMYFLTAANIADVELETNKYNIIVKKLKLLEENPNLRVSPAKNVYACSAKNDT